MYGDNETIRLECLRAAEAAKKGGDPRAILVIADELLQWVKASSGRRAAVPTAQPDLPFEPLKPEQKQLTIKEMVKALLVENRARGMTALEILAAIQERWMPQLVRTSLSPQLSRLKRDGEIVHQYGLYRLSNGNASPGDQGEASNA